VRVLAVIVLALFVAAPVLGAEGRDPRQLVLARSDLPAGAKIVAKKTGAAPAVTSVLVDSSGRALVRASHHYQVAYHLPAKDVVSAAFVFGSRAAARLAFTKLSRSLPDVYRRRKAPRLGDTQLVAYVIADAYEHRFIVRRGNVVWQLDILDWSAAPRTRLTAAAYALARKQQARIG
jgi:hypothetical protein